MGISIGDKNFSSLDFEILQFLIFIFYCSWPFKSSNFVLKYIVFVYLGLGYFRFGTWLFSVCVF